MGQRRFAVGGWRSAALEVGGKGEIIANFGFKSKKLGVSGKRTEDRRRRTERRRWRFEVGGALRLRLEARGR